MTISQAELEPATHRKQQHRTADMNGTVFVPYDIVGTHADHKIMLDSYIV